MTYYALGNRVFSSMNGGKQTMKQFWWAVVVVAVAVGAFAAGWNLRPVERYQFRTVGELPAVFNTSTAELYIWTTNGVVRLDFPTARRTRMQIRDE
jgi:hypothetical protein